LGLLAAEHEFRVAAAFDFAWWQSQFSDERLSGPHAFRAVTFSFRLQPPVLPAFQACCMQWDSELPTPRIIGPSNKEGFDSA